MKITIENQDFEVKIEKGKLTGTLIKREKVDVKSLPYMMCRTFSAGVFAGYLENRVGKEVVLRNARRIWYWAGASSLSELATKGTSKPSECKFPCEVDRVDLLEAIEIIPITEEAKKSIKSVPVWTQFDE